MFCRRDFAEALTKVHQSQSQGGRDPSDRAFRAQPPRVGPTRLFSHRRPLAGVLPPTPMPAIPFEKFLQKSCVFSTLKLSFPPAPLILQVCKLWYDTVKTIELWARGMRQPFDLSRGVFAQLQGQDFLVTSLSHIVNDAENATVSHRIGVNPSDFQDFAIDPTQDLGVSSYLAPGGVAHLEPRAISTHQPHSLATQPVLSFPLYESEAIATQIVDDVIAMGLNEFSGPNSIEDLELSSPRSYFLVQSGDEMYPMGRIKTYTFDGTYSATHTTTLLLPTLLPDQRISSCVSDHKDKTLAMVVPWEEWGPQNSRLLPGVHAAWIKPIHGERVAFACNIPNVVQVLEFRVNAGRADMPVDPTPAAGFNIELHLEPTVFPIDSVFGNAVTTTLPYRSMWRVLEEESDQFLMDQDRLFGISLSSSPNRKMPVYTF
ncbi:hypothetical protein B0H19DRAFT_1236962 [Mycena capillaripes]|nr:hypothetical protein B0H19DRAFT_1236962 [Mycena capillaripes]